MLMPWARRLPRLLCATIAVICTAWAACIGIAHAQDADDGGLRVPARLTVGVGDQFLGQLAPPNSPLSNMLLFVSNRSIVTEIYVQDLEQGRERRLFDEGADVTWPRISPDGRRLLYISFRREAGGQLCVRELPKEGSQDDAVGNRRCLGAEVLALQAEWKDSAQIVLLHRTTIQDDLQLSLVEVVRANDGDKDGEVDGEGDGQPVGKLKASPMPSRNLSSPAVSPDGRWLVYVPVQRSAKPVGPGFASRASAQLEALRLDLPGAAPMPLALDLPGQSGQPVFSPDGRWLYVTQFFTDSNADGVIDADDRGVLFRLPFDTRRDDAAVQAAAASPDQLTSQAWNCQYPAPAAETLVATCERGGSLDVYQLPLDGQVPAEWDIPRLRTELGMAGRKADEILLYRHRTQLETRPRPRRLLLMRMARLHLGLEDFDAAAFYARRMGAVEDPATAGLEAPLRVLIEHRHGLKLAEQGRTLAAAGRMTQAEQGAALDTAAAPSPSAAALRHVVRSELAQAAGDFGRARRELEAATKILMNASVDRTPRAVLEAWHERADALYRLLGERAALVAASRWLSQHPVLNADDQLDHARAAVRALYRGRPYSEADAALVEALAQSKAQAPSGPAGAGQGSDSAWVFALELGRHLIALREERVPRVQRERLLAFYRQQGEHPDAAVAVLRQRALVQDAVARASELGADTVIELLASAYVDDTRVGTQERRRAERLYSRALLGRAYRRLANQRHDEARADFDLVTQRTGALEAAVESVNLRLRAGVAPAVIEQEVTTTVPGMAEPLQRFVKAYVITRQLGRIEYALVHQQATASALAELRAAWPVLKNRREAQALQGAIWHEDFLRNRDAASAERANRHYRVALDLVRNNLRYRAMLLGALGLLHTEAGNFAIALGYLDERDKLPYTDDAAGLAVSLARARALLHTGRDAEAARAADDALEMVDAASQNPGSRLAARYSPLVLDRAALYNLSAGHFDRALALYDRLLPAPAAGAGDEAAASSPLEPLRDTAREPAAAPSSSPRNALVQRLARSAAALGANQPKRALADLTQLERELAQPAAQAALQMPGSRATPAQALRAQRIVAAGLRAQAHTRLSQLDEAALALEQRRDLFSAQFSETDRDQDLSELTLVELQLAENAVDRGDATQTARWLGRAMRHADTLAKRTGAPVDAGQLNTLWFAAQWQVGVQAAGPGTAKARLPFDLPTRLEQARRVLAQRPERDAAWRAWLAWFEVYQALAEDDSVPAASRRPAVQ
ncbi:PD40 domain-containing protein [Hylemonella gracilis]|uniref:PD40 domain-containing protein n=1 Tax=Hylemonella gracilis TaxID=80880 RepID=UPI000558303F|nr:PD40 domain-containing protein [Hylemonella gracilis]